MKTMFIVKTNSGRYLKDSKRGFEHTDCIDEANLYQTTDEALLDAEPDQEMVIPIKIKILSVFGEELDKPKEMSK